MVCKLWTYVSTLLKKKEHVPYSATTTIRSSSSILHSTARRHMGQAHHIPPTTSRHQVRHWNVIPNNCPPSFHPRHQRRREEAHIQLPSPVGGSTAPKPNGGEAAVYEEEGSASPGLYDSGQAAGSAPEGDEATVYEEGIFKLKVYPILASSGGGWLRAGFPVQAAASRQQVSDLHPICPGSGDPTSTVDQSSGWETWPGTTRYASHCARIPSTHTTPRYGITIIHVLL
jgi:hypothetical protein